METGGRGISRRGLFAARRCRSRLSAWLRTLQDGNTSEARLELLRADHLQPDMPETLYALGKAESSKTNYAAAEKA